MQSSSHGSVCQSNYGRFSLSGKPVTYDDVYSTRKRSRKLQEYTRAVFNANIDEFGFPITETNEIIRQIIDNLSTGFMFLLPLFVNNTFARFSKFYFIIPRSAFINRLVFVH